MNVEYMGSGNKLTEWYVYFRIFQSLCRYINRYLSFCVLNYLNKTSYLYYTCVVCRKPQTYYNVAVNK